MASVDTLLVWKGFSLTRNYLPELFSEVNGAKTVQCYHNKLINRVNCILNKFVGNATLTQEDVADILEDRAAIQGS